MGTHDDAALAFGTRRNFETDNIDKIIRSNTKKRGSGNPTNPSVYGVVIGLRLYPIHLETLIKSDLTPLEPEATVYTIF